MSRGAHISKNRLHEILNRVNQLLDRGMPVLTPLGIALGVALPAFFLIFRPFMPWLFATMTLAGALKLRVRELGKAASSPLPILLFFFTSRIVLPVVIFFLSSLVFRNDPDTVSGYVLLFSVPTAVTGFIWVSIFRGDGALVLDLILLDAILAPLVVPATVRLLLGTSIHMDMTGMTVALAYMVVIPTVVGVGLNELSRGKVPAIITPYLAPLSKICLVIMISANGAAVAPQIKPDNPRMWIIIAACVCFSAVGFACAKLSSLVGKLSREKRISLFFASGLRNTAAAMTLGTEFFPAAAALPSVLGIMFQQSIAAIMGRILMGKIDGENEKGQAAAE